MDKDRHTYGQTIPGNIILDGSDHHLRDYLIYGINIVSALRISQIKPITYDNYLMIIYRDAVKLGGFHNLLRQRTGREGFTKCLHK